jgi:hypothetical protein
VLKHERERLDSAGRSDLASKALHIAELEGDGAGYDVRSFELDGTPRFIEVKTTRGGKQEDFTCHRMKSHSLTTNRLNSIYIEYSTMIHRDRLDCS